MAHARQDLHEQGIEAYLALVSIFADEAAPLLELTSSQVFSEFWPLRQEAAFVKPGLVTLKTLAGMEAWSNRTMAAHTEGPLNSALKLRWMRSHSGG